MLRFTSTKSGFKKNEKSKSKVRNSNTKCVKSNIRTRKV